MVNYADPDNIKLLLTGLLDDLSDDLLDYSLVISDNWVDSKVEGVNKSSPPVLVANAAEYFSAVFLLRNFFDVSENDSRTATWYEEQANDLIGAYIASVADEESDIHPYSSSETPTHRYTERNLRTTTDDNDDIDNVSEDTWTSEG